MVRLCSILGVLSLAVVPLSSALKFDLQAHTGHSSKYERCIRNFVAKDTLVLVTAIVSGQKGDGQMVNMHIKDAVGNEYGRPKDIAGETRMAFTSHADAAFDVCFENQLTTTGTVMNPTRHVELDIDIGADARDWSAIQAQEKLKPVETELRRVEELVGEIVTEMDYLRTREQKLRDTNESTNERVKWFAFGTMGMLVGLGAWQVVYLRAYFSIAGAKPLASMNASGCDAFIFNLLTPDMVAIFVGKTRKPCNVHRELLCDRSDYFRKAFHGGFKEAQTNLIILPDIDAATFELFLQIIYGNTFDIWSVIGSKQFKASIPLRCFAHTILTESLQNDCVGAIRMYYYPRVVESDFNFAEHLALLYKNPVGTKPRFCLCWAAAHGATAKDLAATTIADLSEKLERGGDFVLHFIKLLVYCNHNAVLGYSGSERAGQVFAPNFNCMFHDHYTAPICKNPPTNDLGKFRDALRPLE
ncbi:MAG: hypothetical protein Q9201_004374 [Fulgogasparrea decipioides]